MMMMTTRCDDDGGSDDTNKTHLLAFSCVFLSFFIHLPFPLHIIRLDDCNYFCYFCFSSGFYSIRFRFEINEKDKKNSEFLCCVCVFVCFDINNEKKTFGKEKKIKIN